MAPTTELLLLKSYVPWILLMSFFAEYSLLDNPSTEMVMKQIRDGEFFAVFRKILFILNAFYTNLGVNNRTASDSISFEGWLFSLEKAEPVTFAVNRNLVVLVKIIVSKESHSV